MVVLLSGSLIPAEDFSSLLDWLVGSSSPPWGRPFLCGYLARRVLVVLNFSDFKLLKPQCSFKALEIVLYIWPTICLNTKCYCGCLPTVPWTLWFGFCLNMQCELGKPYIHRHEFNNNVCISLSEFKDGVFNSGNRTQNKEKSVVTE